MIKEVYMLDILAIQQSDGEELFEEARRYFEGMECANGDAEQCWLDDNLEQNSPALYAYIMERVESETKIIYIKREW